MFKIAVATLILFAGEAMAQIPCSTHDNMIEIFKGYKEEPIGSGSSAKRTQIVELLVSDSGSFSIIITNQLGITCFIVGGKDWKSIIKGEKL